MCLSVRSFVRSFVRSLITCSCACLFFFARAFFSSFVCSFACLFVWLVALFLRDFLVGNATTARVIRNRIYEATGGKSQDVGRQIGHHHKVKDKEPQEATGVQI